MNYGTETREHFYLIFQEKERRTCWNIRKRKGEQKKMMKTFKRI